MSGSDRKNQRPPQSSTPGRSAPGDEPEDEGTLVTDADVLRAIRAGAPIPVASRPSKPPPAATKSQAPPPPPEQDDDEIETLVADRSKLPGLAKAATPAGNPPLFDPPATTSLRPPPPNKPNSVPPPPKAPVRASVPPPAKTPVEERSTVRPTAPVRNKKDPFALAGTTLEGRFRVEVPIAEGGFGIVYKGTHLSLEKPVALKVLRLPPTLPEQSRGDFLKHFQLEAKTIAKMSHPHIVQVLDTGVSRMPSGEFAPWMALEWIEGQTLERVLFERRGKPYTPEEAMRILRPIAEALSYAHDQRIAHRDVKPGNIMLVPDRRGPIAKLLDFGIAKIMSPGEGPEAEKTRGTALTYSPRYAAPEQVAAQRSGPWTDVHALGLLLTEMLAGKQAIAGTETGEVLRNALAAERPTPAQLGFDAGAWEPVLARALRYKPEERFQHAGEFLAALEEAIPTLQNTGSFATAPAAKVAAATPPAPVTPTAPTATKNGQPPVVLAIAVGIVVAIVVTLIVLFALRKH